MLKINPFKTDFIQFCPSFKGYATVPLITVEVPTNLYTQIPVGQNGFYYIPKTQEKTPKINQNVLVERGIIGKNENADALFKRISAKIFSNKNDANNFYTLLNCGAISLSSSCYRFLEGKLPNPDSAIAVELNPAKKITQNIASLEPYIKNENGIGINLSKFDNPIELIQKINSYFKFRQNEGDTTRPPAGIALLNINHPKILDFISLKDNANYDDWCFDLSVVLPLDFFEKVDKNENISLSDGNTMSAKTIYSKLLASMLNSGEPGVIFSNDQNYICDSCAAAQLKPNEGLCLAHINLAEFYKNGSIDDISLKGAAQILSKVLQTINPNGYIGILGYQELLNKAACAYGSDKALKILESALSIIQKEAKNKNLKTAISPTGTISRILKVKSGIEPDIKNTKKELETMAVAQKYLDGNISKTIMLSSNSTTEIDEIIRKAHQLGLRGITVFRE